MTSVDVVCVPESLVVSICSIRDVIWKLSNEIVRKDQPTSFYTEINEINKSLKCISGREPPSLVD
jgi:hypothetical protein